MANLQHLIAALGKVADAYAPDPNDDPDASDKDPEDDPGNDDGDPLDDPRSYSPDEDEADRENAEDKDGDDEDDFSKPKVFSTVMLEVPRVKTGLKPWAERYSPFGAQTSPALRLSATLVRSLAGNKSLLKFPLSIRLPRKSFAFPWLLKEH
jgi:hypothetical protein